MEGLYITVYDNSLEILASNAELPDFGKITYYFDDNYYLDHITHIYNFSAIAEEDPELADDLMSLCENTPDAIVDGYTFTFTTYVEEQDKLSKEQMLQNIEGEYILHYAE